ncbi:unannotated protein [freshwater metagenome]|jgi:cytochrome c oxidase assembly protein subunit 15|uniref:Unannotated protein n=1 Tax=freshwater metagenome TaxID=449393 RepID=A0A6J6MYM4_9ZZZZ|nr:hypothetical protein [Actinomycetota bacterium]MSZ05927.1 hypothetical protein [Actinomycetota bacterium]
MSRSRTLALRILAPASGILLFLQAAIMVTGGGVRLTGSGLGCPTWPECTPGSYVPVPGQAEGHLHSWIEFGNRLLTFVLVAAALVTLIAVLRAGRKDLRVLAAGQFLGIFGQGILGGITVLVQLNPIAVASHYLLTTVLIAGATSLYTRRKIPAQKKLSPLTADIFSRVHITLSAFVIVLGTVVTGAGPHAGDINAPRLHIRIQNAAQLHGGAVAFLLLFSIAFYFAPHVSEQTKSILRIFFIASIAQGLIGVIQYVQGVPELLVATHLAGSAIVWIIAWRVWLTVQREEKVSA